MISWVTLIKWCLFVFYYNYVPFGSNRGKCKIVKVKSHNKIKLSDFNYEENNVDLKVIKQFYLQSIPQIQVHTFL